MTGYGYCQCGCGGKTAIAKQTYTSRGIKKGDPFKYIQNHGTKGIFKKPNSRYVVDSETGCWNWNLSVDEGGYGHASVNGKKVRSHVEAYVRTYGPVPDGHEVHHKCENRKCVNPNHLEALKKADHLREHHAVLTPEKVRAIRKKYEAGGISQYKLADEYGVHRSTIWHAINSNWKEVTS